MVLIGVLDGRNGEDEALHSILRGGWNRRHCELLNILRYTECERPAAAKGHRGMIDNSNLFIVLAFV